MKICLLREVKKPAEKRAPLTPKQCVDVQQIYPHVTVIVQSDPRRIFTDDEYRSAGILVQEDISHCDLMLGIKEVKPENLMPGKTYLFFSHTIKMQPQNRKLLQMVLKRKVTLIDYEILTDKNGNRIIGFGHFAGLVGAYNGFRALGLRSRLFELKPAHQCVDLQEMLEQLNQIKVPPVKIAVTGGGRVAGGVIEIMDHLHIRRLTPYEYIKIKKPVDPVYTQLSISNYVKHKDGERFDMLHFINYPECYENAFLPFARTSDLLITAAYWDPRAPVLFTEEDMRNKDFRIRIVSDITCDIDGSVPSTKKASSIDQPFYDYNPQTGHTEPPFSKPEHITVQAVDNLPGELPRDASEDFGRNLMEKVLPALLSNKKSEIITRATIAKNGKLTPRFSYLQAYAEYI